MVVVDDEDVAVATTGMAVWMAVRLRAFPALVLVPVMLVMQMRMFVVEWRMHVETFGGVIRRPDRPGGERGQQRAAGHGSEGQPETEMQAEPS